MKAVIVIVVLVLGMVFIPMLVNSLDAKDFQAGQEGRFGFKVLQKQNGSLESVVLVDKMNGGAYLVTTSISNSTGKEEWTLFKLGKSVLKN